MFQFRAFPSYAYLFQRTIHRYCLCGFPHSEISGSTDICSSPKLIAACHVLHRLLMPRHSPCALYSLTFVDASSLSFTVPSGTSHSFRCVSSSRHKHLRWFVPRVFDFAFRNLSRLRFKRFLVLLNYAGNLQIFFAKLIVTHIFSDVPQLIQHFLQLSS